MIQNAILNMLSTAGKAAAMSKLIKGQREQTDTMQKNMNELRGAMNNIKTDAKFGIDQVGLPEEDITAVRELRSKMSAVNRAEYRANILDAQGRAMQRAQTEVK